MHTSCNVRHNSRVKAWSFYLFKFSKCSRFRRFATFLLRPPPVHVPFRCFRVPLE
nr:MAG TPA: hypothetical protein [Caudoviricetes sp.]